MKHVEINGVRWLEWANSGSKYDEIAALVFLQTTDVFEPFYLFMLDFLFFLVTMLRSSPGYVFL